MRVRRIYNKSIFYDNLLIYSPLKLNERIVQMAKKDPKRANKAKIAVAREFGLPTHKHVNLEKTMEYLKYTKSPTAQNELFLDSLDDERHARGI